MRIRDPIGWVPLRIKLPLAFVLLGVATLAITGIVTAGSAHVAMEQQVGRQLDLLAASEAAAVRGQLDLLLRRLEDFCSDGYVREQALRLQQPDSPAGVRETLLQHLVTNKLPLVDCVNGCAVLSAGGDTLLAVAAPDIAAAVPAALAGTWSGPLRPPDDERRWPTLLIGSPLYDLARERRIGALVLVVRVDHWLAAFRRPVMDRPVDGLRAWLEDANGLAVRLPATPGAAAELLTGDAELPGPSPLQLRRPLAGTPWTVIVDTDAASVMAPVHGVMRSFAVTAGLVLLVGGVLLAILIQFVLRPLGRLRDSAQRMAAGDLDVDVPTDTRDEIGQLARSFATMTEAVRERSVQLEARATDLRRLEQIARHERDRLNRVIHSMDDGLFILDADGTVTLANAAAAPVLARLCAAGASDRIRCYHRAPQAGNCADCLLHWQSAGEPCVVRIDGRVYELAITALTIGERGERVFVSRDVTERFRQAQVQAHQERMTVMGGMVALIAHELNNPLAAISMFSELIEAGLPADSPLREYATVIRRNTAHGAATIRTLLETATQAPPEVESLDVHEVLEDVVSFLDPLTRKAGVTVELLPDASRQELDGDERSLRQVFINLVMNAVQASGTRNGARVRLVTSDADDGDGLLIDVIDNGPGVPDDARDTVFRPFFTTKAPGIGTGLGLPTSRRIIEAHGGTLDLLESRPGHTVFRVTLHRHASSDRIRLELAGMLAGGPASPHNGDSGRRDKAVGAAAVSASDNDEDRPR